MSDPELPPRFEDAIRAELSLLVASGPQPAEAQLDALESRSPTPPPARRTQAILAAAAVTIALLGIGVVLVRSGDKEPTQAVTTVPHDCVDATIEPNLAVPAPYSDEARVLVPLTSDLGQPSPAGTPTVVPGAGSAEIRYPSGEVFRFTTAPGGPQQAAPEPFPTTREEAEVLDQETATSATSGMTANGKVTTVESPIPIRLSFIESLAREAAELPETIATAIAQGEAFSPIQQSFEVGGHQIDRTIQVADGVVHVSTDLTSAGAGGVRSDGRELSMMVGAARPGAVLEFEANSRYQWLVFVPKGLEAELTSAADRCTAVIGDDLTGGEYRLIEDGNGDEKATMQVTTTGRPDKVILSKYVG